jgi:hypothetical protein
VILLMVYFSFFILWIEVIDALAFANEPGLLNYQARTRRVDWREGWSLPPTFRLLHSGLRRV